MHWVKITAIVVIGGLCTIQLIQPARNKSGQASTNDLTSVVQVPVNIQALLVRSCYDCHSSNTNYLWYDYIQPGRWLVEYHIRHGKASLNFSEFSHYSARKRMNKFHAIATSMKEETMPIPSYIALHVAARLTPSERKEILNWAIESNERCTQIRDSIEHQNSNN